MKMTMTNTWINIKTTSVFLNNYESKKKININRWGTRSWKTYNLLKLVLFWLMTWKIDDSDKYFEFWILSIVRKYWSTLSKTIQRDFDEIINSEKFWEVYISSLLEINKTERIYKYKWRTIEFLWADDQQKLRWGKRDILYCNEANELSYNSEFFQLLIRTKYKVFIDFNPDDEEIWINREIEQKRRLEEKDVRVIVSTYKDNPYLSEAEIKEIERLEKTDPMFWKIYWLWEYWKIQWLIFENFSIVRNIPSEAKLLWRWQDFWFTNDPSALVSVYLYNNELYVNEEIYQTQLTNQDLINKYKTLWIKPHEEIFWDNAEPKSIEEIYRAWFNIKPVIKWPDSIMFWISIMKEFKINITETSINLIKEFKHYKWALDKEGKALNKPIDEFNHWIDSVRYVCMMKLKRNQTFDIAIW